MTYKFRPVIYKLSYKSIRLPLGGAFAAGVKILTKRIAEVEKFAAVVEVCRCSKFAGGLISRSHNL